MNFLSVQWNLQDSSGEKNEQKTSNKFDLYWLSRICNDSCYANRSY